jgi:type I restriction enzyme S subunit
MAKYQKYAEYKDSGIEWADKLPAHWNSVHLKWISTIYAGGTPSKTIESYWENGTVPWINSGAVNQTYILEPSTYITKTAYENSSAKWIPKKALVMALAGQGKTKGMVAQLGIDTTCNQSMGAIIPNDLSYARYLFWWITSNYQNIRNMAGGDLRDGLNLEHLGNMNCPLPTYEETQKIANFLDHETAQIDSLIAKQEKLIELLKEKRQAVISHAVTKGLNPDAAMKDSGVEWLGQVPEHWTVSKLKHFVNVVDCKHITAEFFDEGIPLASIGEVKGWKVNLSNAKLTNEKYYQELIDGNRKPQVGDIIYTRNATVGEASLVHAELPKFALGQDVCLIHIIQKLSSEYLLHFLKSEIIKIQLNSAMVGSTFKRINVDDIRNYVIVIPPIEEQECILKDLDQKIEKYDSLINFAVKQIQLMQERRTALISSAVTGKIDVRNWQYPNEAKTELSA